MQTITYYSYKGGAGRTLLVAASAYFLAECGKKVFLLDFDLEAPGLHCKFGLNCESIKYGLIDFLVDYQNQKEISDSFKPIYINDNIQLLPAGNAPDNNYAQKLLQINWNSLFSEESQYAGFQIFQYLKDYIQNEYQPDYLLVDSRTGITEIGGIALNKYADQLVYLFTNNIENTDGINSIFSNIGTPKKFIVFSRVPEPDEDVSLNDIIDRIKPGIIKDKSDVYLLHNDPSIQVLEKIKYDTSTTLRESILLKDYLLLFKDLFPDEIRASKFNKLFVSPQINELFKSKSLLSRKKFDKSIKDRINDRRSEGKRVIINYLPPKYFDVEYYKQFIEELLDIIGKSFNSDYLKHVPLSHYNYDILGIQMVDGLFDFCGDLYFQTESRGSLLDLIKLGMLDSYTCVVKNNTNLYKTLIKDPSDLLNSGSTISMFKHLIKDYKDIEIGLILSHAVSSECYKNLSEIGYSHKIISRNNESELIDWYLSPNGQIENKVIFCEHKIGENILNIIDSRKNIAYTSSDFATNSNLSFKYSSPIPIGLIHPEGDYEWRKVIVKSLCSLLLNNNGINWAGDEDSMMALFKDNYLTALPSTEFINSLMMDLPLDEAIEWYDKYNAISKIQT